MGMRVRVEVEKAGDVRVFARFAFTRDGEAELSSGVLMLDPPMWEHLKALIMAGFESYQEEEMEPKHYEELSEGLLNIGFSEESEEN